MNSIKKLISIALVSLFIISCSDDSNNDTGGVIIDDEGISVDTSGNTKTTGTSANELLSEQKFDKLYLEIVYVEGFKPTDETISNFSSFLEQRLNKSGGIEIEQREIASPGLSVYSINDIIDIETEQRSAYNNENEIAVYAFFADGEYSENTENGSVLGVAYRNTSFVMFEKTIQDFSENAFAPSLSVLETTVINHEFGHLLGLVNAGSTPQSDHQDTEHGRHCDVDNCLMYWTAETGEGLLSMLTGGSIASLDAQCIADLQANGGK